MKNKNKLLAEAAHRKAEVEADLHRLQLEQEAEAASREADIYQAAAEWEDHQPLDLGDENRAQRTREYAGPHNNPTLSRYPPRPTSHPTSEDYTNAPPPMPDFATYLIRREMVSSGLTQFDNRPEN